MQLRRMRGRLLLSPCMTFSQALSVNSLRWRIRDERAGNTSSLGPRDPKRFGPAKQWGLGTRQGRLNPHTAFPLSSYSFFPKWIFLITRPLYRPYSRYAPSLHTLKDWWDKSNVTWFLRGQITDKIANRRNRGRVYCRQQEMKTFSSWR